uniref:histidine kinase n=1 Tax=candidate division WOR-3 bacterium TaxID=2052148 RepID=A0A7C6AA54_UNCW3
MKRTIFFKLFAGYLLITITLATSILIFSFRTIKDHYISSLVLNLKNIGNTFGWEITSLLEQGKWQQVDSLAKTIGEQLALRITVINPDGTVIADSKTNPKTMENHQNRPEVIQALSHRTGKSIRYSQTLKEEMLYVAVPIVKEKAILGVFRTSLALKTINVLLNNLRTKILRITLVITILSILLGLILSQSLTQPIKELVKAARRVASGDFGIKVFLRKQDELAELADSFNYMTEQIKNSFTELAQQKDELNAIIASIQEGLVVIDEKGRIRLSNDGFKKIVQNNQVANKFYWEVFREPNFSNQFKKVKDEKLPLTAELEFNDRVFLTSFAFIPSKNEVVAILHDITEFRKLEKIKRDFVLSASHELRTPLTVIKGYVETLQTKISKKNQQYLNVIMRHTERLINIVSDLLNLSELEEKVNKPEFELVNIKNLVENIKTLFASRFKEKNLALKLNIEEKLPLISGDSFKLEQMLINLVDNAIKYTEKGEVEITAQRLNQSIRITIKDTGIGIAQEHLSRIFERFYVVDKSHSRRMGGTGLGLSIVKHIVLLHNGEIEVESTPGVGTKFIITLPLSQGK